MSALIWKDKTSYSRGTKERIPSVLELNIDGTRIIIHRIIHCEGWHLTVYSLQVNDRSLKSEELEDAKIEGLKIVIDKIREMSSIANKLIAIIE